MPNGTSAAGAPSKTARAVYEHGLGCRIFVNDKQLRSLYQAAYGSGDADEDGLVEIASHVLATYYQFRCQMTIEPPSQERYARIIYEPGGKPVPIRITSDTFDDPVQLGDVLGHEVIHRKVQFDRARRYTTRETGFSQVITAFWELEAYSWETLAGAGSVIWAIGKNRFWPYLGNDARQECLGNLREAADTVKQEIRSVITGPRGSVYGRTLKRWIETDDNWVTAAWLPDNQDWLNAEFEAAGAR